MQKIILFYKFIPLSDPRMAMLWQKELCSKLQLKGRIIVSPHGINGILGGALDSLRAYKREMNKSITFKAIHYKWSAGGADEFPRLSIKVRPELVSFGLDKNLIVNDKGIVGGGRHLKPHEVNELVAKRGKDVVFFDGRNSFEAAIGRFKNAVVPNTQTSKDFIAELERPQYQALKDRPIVTYCTGGIRCEVLSSLMKQRGFNEVYQLDGGIQKYGEKFGDDGLWEGKMYVFDGRIATGFSDKSVDIGRCVHCDSKTSRYVNCAVVACNKQILVCSSCSANSLTCNSSDCKSLVPTK